MGLTAIEVLGVLMRWMHITSVVMLIGGVAYARAVAVPVLGALPEDERLEAWQALTARYRPLVYATILALLVSGVYNLLTHPGHTRYYHIWFGVKMLLAAHVFASALLMARPIDKAGESKLARRMTGLVISGVIVILIAAFLRRIF